MRKILSVFLILLLTLLTINNYLLTPIFADEIEDLQKQINENNYTG